MKEILELQKKIIPELTEVLQKRYRVLRSIYYSQPIGRRALATELNLGERIVRTEVDFLKSQDLIEVNTQGMTITNEGINVVDKLESFIHELKGLNEIEQSIKNSLGIKDVIIVHGEIESNPKVIKDLGKAAANYLKNIIQDNDVIALTGGSTIKEVIEEFPKLSNLSNVLVVPARGGMGKNVESQANTLAAFLARKLNGNYKFLHIPENISQDVQEKLLQEEQIIDVINSIQQSNILIYGVGNAIHMAKKRGASDEFIAKLRDMEAIGEAYGCYFNKDSQRVYENNSIGINISEAKNIRTHIAVAAGKNKADAIIATEMYNKNTVLVTDESTAIEIEKIVANNTLKSFKI